MAERRPPYAPEYRRQMVCASPWCGQVARPGSWLGSSSVQSVQGTQYTSLAFDKHCRETGGRHSTGSVGDCYNNAMTESFFAALECEFIDRRSFHTRAQAKREVFDTDSLLPSIRRLQPCRLSPIPHTKRKPSPVHETGVSPLRAAHRHPPVSGASNTADTSAAKPSSSTETAASRGAGAGSPAQ